jgi:Cu-Zn family superoxide dismutase
MKYQPGYTLCVAMIATMVIAASARAEDLTVTMHMLTQDGTSKDIGTIVIAQTAAGATFILNLHDLPPGAHGFHVHENGICGPTLMNGVRIPGGAAGSHWDPDHTYKHLGPTGQGHMGDLPVLDVGLDGTAKQTLTAPRIMNINALKEHAMIIHAGGGARIACGVIE